MAISYDLFFFITENDIDGATLCCLMDDKDEFHAVFPKSGHRLHLKRVVKSLELEAQNVCVPVKVEEAEVVEQAQNVIEAQNVIDENAVSLVQTHV